MEKIKIKKINNSAKAPFMATDGAAAYDICVCEDVVVNRGRNLIRTGFAMQLPKGFCAEIHPRSGYALKGFAGERKMNTSLIETGRFDADVVYGLIDEDYRGEVGVIVINRAEPFTVKKGQRIAQMVIRKVEKTCFEEVEKLNETKRGNGGFNSTGL